MKSLESIYRHIRDHGGYIVGRRALGAWREAKRASIALEAGLTVRWELESDDWMNFAGDPIEEYREKFASGEWECFQAWVEADDGSCLASLGGIVLNRDSQDYKQCVEYELLAEAIGELLKGGAA